MAQLTIYLDDSSIAAIEEAAKAAKTSVSKWVKESVHRSLAQDWPPGYFDAFGSLYGADLPAAPDLPAAADAKREAL